MATEPAELIKQLAIKLHIQYESTEKSFSKTPKNQDNTPFILSKSVINILQRTSTPEL